MGPESISIADTANESAALNALREAIRAAADTLGNGTPDASSLSARTSHLARPLVDDDRLLANAQQVLTFQLGHDEHAVRYAWPIAAVHGLIHVERLTPIPSAPPVYRGLVNWRGTVLATIDLRVYFGQPLPADPSPWVIVIGSDRAGGATGVTIGVLADDVFDLSTLQTAEVSPLPDSGGSLIAGITPDKLLLLNVGELLARAIP